MLLSIVVLAAAFGAAQEPQDPPPPATEAAPAAQAEAPPAPAANEGAEVHAEPLPASAQPLIEAGLAAFNRRRYTQAEIEFRKALEADPSSAAAAFYLGYTYYKQAEPKRAFHPDKRKAAEMFARAYELDPAFRPAWGPRR